MNIGQATVRITMSASELEMSENSTHRYIIRNTTPVQRLQEDHGL